MSNKLFAVTSIIAMVFLVVMINLTTPSEIGPFGVLVFFTLVYFVALGVLTLLCRLFFWLRQRVGMSKVKVSNKKSFYFASFLAFVPIILIFMRSFGPLNIFELTLVGLFAVVACFLVSKKT